VVLLMYVLHPLDLPLALMPVLLGSGIPLLPPGALTSLKLADHKTLPSGITVLSYTVPGGRSASIRYVKPAKKRSAKNSHAKKAVIKKAVIKKRMTKKRPGRG